MPPVHNPEAPTDKRRLFELTQAAKNMTEDETYQMSKITLFWLLDILKSALTLLEEHQTAHGTAQDHIEAVDAGDGMAVEPEAQSWRLRRDALIEGLRQ